MNRTARMTALLWIAALSPFAGGCVWTPELNNVKQDIASQIPGATFEHEVSFAIGPGGMALARAVTSLVAPAHEARNWLEDVSRIEVAMYDVVRSELPQRLQTPQRIAEMLVEGWEMAARVRQENEAAWVLYKLDGDSVREVFVVALDREELVMVKVKGHLERVIARALNQCDGTQTRAFHHGS
ncbi:MAG TPA: DUF4252 domain-containing protein [Candidatus Krumholzibacteria bacterium]|nr:DUF4252 domain-containing protein [Candidatus Krumholzibacteria bacterium]